MFKILTVFAVTGLFLAGCTTEDADAVTKDDVEQISAGDGSGSPGPYTGLWTLETQVTSTSCDAYSTVISGLPSEGEADEEEQSLVQNDGVLTTLLGDDVYDGYTFNGSVDDDGGFTYGMYYELPIGGVTVNYIEVVEGTMTVTNNGNDGTLTATSKRRYQATIGAIGVDCTAKVKLTGTKDILSTLDDVTDGDEE